MRGGGRRISRTCCPQEFSKYLLAREASMKDILLSPLPQGICAAARSRGRRIDIRAREGNHGIPPCPWSRLPFSFGALSFPLGLVVRLGTSLSGLYGHLRRCRRGRGGRGVRHGDRTLRWGGIPEANPTAWERALCVLDILLDGAGASLRRRALGPIPLPPPSLPPLRPPRLSPSPFGPLGSPPPWVSPSSIDGSRSATRC